MGSLLAIIGVLGAAIAWLFNRNQQSKALLNTLQTKEQDLTEKQKIVENAGKLEAESVKRENINENAEDKKNEGENLTNEQIAADLLRRITGK